jgi:O-antigen ligase
MATFADMATLLMAFFVLLCLVQARQWQLKGSRLAVLVYGVALLAAVSITHLSMGRTGYIVLAAVLLAFVGMVLRGRALLTGIAVCAAALALTLWASDVMRARFVQGWEEAQRHEVDKVSSIGHRLNNYKTTTQLIAEKPVLGSGTGAYHTAICPFIEAPAQCDFFAWHPHNQFLFFAADHGLVGLALYLGLIVAVATAGWRSPDPLFMVITVGFAVLLAVDSMVNSPLWSSRESHLFAYFLGLLGTIRTKI